MNIFTAISEYLRETEGLQEEWNAYRISCLPEDAPDGQMKVWGAVAPRQKKHPELRDWRRKDPDTKSVHFVSKSDLDDWYEKKCETQGACPDCGGKGYSIVGWNKKTGNRIRSCRRCDHTGRYVAKEGRA